jgi:DNA-binding PadR family transcriptional regulator
LSFSNPDSHPEIPELGWLSEPALLILVSLAGGPKHGYAMVEDIEKIAGVKLGPGTLYGAIARLEKEGLIEPLPTEDRRKPYKLTAHGETTLQTRLKSVSKFAKTGLTRLGEI